MTHSPHEKKEIEKDLTDITDFDIFELYQGCIKVFADVSSKLDLDQHRCFELGQILWERSIEARDKYRSGHSEKLDPKR